MVSYTKDRKGSRQGCLQVKSISVDRHDESLRVQSTNMAGKKEISPTPERKHLWLLYIVSTNYRSCNGATNYIFKKLVHRVNVSATTVLYSTQRLQLQQAYIISI